MKVYSRMNAKLRRRRGVTLVEMLVTLAVLLLMMALVVQIFQAATGSMNAAQVYQRLDDDLRRLDSTLRSDLSGATAKFTPPNDPKLNRGYFEYGENEFADNDGEDVDDYIRLTVKAPAGRPFTGRMWAKPANKLVPIGGVVTSVPGNIDLYNVTTNPGGMSAAERAEYFASQPITVTSEYAEVIYFLRNGNLYRRVLLVAPELQSRILSAYSTPTVVNVGQFPGIGSLPIVAADFIPSVLGGAKVSWQGVNDLSARPAPRGIPTTNGANNAVILNSLGDLTDRHNRFAMPRFADDFVNIAGDLTPDGIPDDYNGDSLPDWYPTLYPNVIEDSVAGGSTTHVLWNVYNPAAITGTPNLYQRRASLAFPYVFRGAYSQAQALGNYSYGWIHAPAPWATNGDGSTTYQFDLDPENYLRYLNHNPLDLGDNAPVPTVASQAWSNLQTIWQFPTWRETLAPEWNDPTFQVNQQGVGHAFPNGLLPSNAITVNASEIASGRVERDPNIAGNQLLPPMTADWRGVRQVQPFTDGTGANTGYFSGDPANALWADNSWEDDLILTNVRSFDVKAFDPTLADYADLGWGDDLRIARPATSVNAAANISLGTRKDLPYLAGNSDANLGGAFGPNPQAYINGGFYNLLDQTFAHEGRMPPRLDDYRFDAQYGARTYSGYPAYTGNIGDDGTNIIRLRRVWDSWSTTYSKAPATGVRPDGFPHGPPFSPPIYPSYPAPYPAPLRGIQIQIRVADPTNQRIKILTIRQDFTDKL